MPETSQADSEHNKETDNQKGSQEGDSLPQVSPVVSPMGLRKIVILGGVFLVALLVVSVFLPHLSERVKFFTVNALSLLVLLAIVVQAYIYRRQWEAMQGQLSAMRTTGSAVEWQAGIMEIQTGLLDKQVEAMQGQLKVVERQTALMESQTCSYVGIHSVDLRRDTKTVILKIENTGNVPADGLKVSYQIILIEQTWDTPTHDYKSDVIEEDFGNIKLFRGNLQIHITIELRDFWLTEKASQNFSLVNQGGVKLHIEGRIDYRDGFGSQNTEFAFVYDPKQDSWSVYSPEVVESGEREAQRIWEEMNSAEMERLEAFENKENYTNED